MKRTTISAVLALIVSAGAAAATIDKYRWWPWRYEFEVIAATSLQTTINQKWDQLIYIERQLKQCQSEGGNCIELRKQQQRLKDEIRNLEIKRDKYQGG